MTNREFGSVSVVYLTYFRDETAGHEPKWGGGKSANCVTPDLSYDKEGERKERKK